MRRVRSPRTRGEESWRVCATEASFCVFTYIERRRGLGWVDRLWCEAGTFRDKGAGVAAVPFAQSVDPFY